MFCLMQLWGKTYLNTQINLTITRESHLKRQGTQKKKKNSCDVKDGYLEWLKYGIR